MSDIFSPIHKKDIRRPRANSRLAQVRVIAGMRQSELAAAVGFSIPWISQVENDLIIPTLQQRIKLAQALGTSVELVFPDDEEDAA